MSIEVNLNEIISGYNLNSINVNFERIKLALENAYNRNGSTDNQLQVDLDVNGNNLLNVNRIKSDVLEIDGVVITPAGLTAVDLVFKDEWAFGLEVDKNNVYTRDGSSFVALVKHTSDSTNQPDVSLNWRDFWFRLSSKGDQGPQGATGTGSGDLIASNNLSDVDNVATARTNLQVPSQSDFDILNTNALLDSDVGDGANQIVQLDGEAKLPAVDGSNLTNISNLGVVKQIAPLERNSSASTQTSAVVQIGSAVSVSVGTVGNRIVVEGNCGNRVFSGSNANQGLTITLKRDGTVVDTLKFNVHVGQSKDSSFYLEYTPTTTTEHDYTVEMQTPNANTVFYASSWFVLKEVA